VAGADLCRVRNFVAAIEEPHLARRAPRASRNAVTNGRTSAVGLVTVHVDKRAITFHQAGLLAMADSVRSAELSWQCRGAHARSILSRVGHRSRYIALCVHQTSFLYLTRSAPGAVTDNMCTLQLISLLTLKKLLYKGPGRAPVILRALNASRR
jgi:hypothetical protein